MADRLKELNDMLNSLRGLLDQADSVEFGQMNKHLDAMATLVDRAVNLVDDVRVELSA